MSTASPQRVLVESDIHEIGQCTQRTWDMICIVAEAYGWQVEKSWESNIPRDNYGVVRHLEENWNTFRKGGHVSVEQMEKQRKNKKLERI